MEGQVALVTGGANGIGECTVRLLCRHGATVAVADIQDEKGEALCRDRAGPGVATYVHCDVSGESHVRDAVDAEVAPYGKVDAVFSKAGIVGPNIPYILENEEEMFERVIAINLTGSFLVTKHAARVMIPAKRGSILVTASVASLIGGKAPYAYTGGKRAVVGLCREAAGELGRHGMRVNCVSPYVVATDLASKGFGVEDDEVVESVAEAYGNLKGGRLKAQDIAEAALYLMNDEAKYVSGHNPVVAGGFTVVKPEQV